TQLPYVAQTPWYIKIWAFPALGAMICALWPSTTPVAFQLWQQGSLLFRLCMIFAAVMIPIGALSAFFERTVFKRTGIEYRSKFLKTMFKPYSDIEALEYTARSLGRPESLKISFSDSCEITITGDTGDLKAIIQIIEAQTITTVPIKYNCRSQKVSHR